MTQNQKSAAPHLYLQVLIAIVLGAGVGYIWPETGVKLKVLGDLFIKLIKMLVGPVIFTTVVLGIGGAKDLKKVRRVGWKALVYFEVVTTFALLIGLLVAHAFEPGAGQTSVNTSQELAKVATYSAAAQKFSWGDFLLHIFPDTLVSAFVEGEILQILVVSILTGVALGNIGTAGDKLLRGIDMVSQLVMKIFSMIMKLAPIGAFGAMAYTVATVGPKTLISLSKLLGCVYLTCIGFIFLVLGTICRLHGFSLIKLLRSIKEELLIVLGTSSSESGFPGLTRKLQKIGCPKDIVGIVLPAGYSFNLDGTSIYLTLAALYIAQATNSHLSMTQEAGLLGLLLVTSKGAAAVTGGGFITLAATLGATHEIPVAGLALILGVDRFLSEARAITNLIGNAVATVVISRWEGAPPPDFTETLNSSGPMEGSANVLP
jgi:aerobic C4-dicarboxylate transport protein